MLVYKTTENNETKFYGVTNNEFFVNDLISDYENADSAGLIDFEYWDNERTAKLINLTLENVNTMKQAFEVYSMVNNQSLKDTRKDFRIAMECYCDDDKPETFYRVATLDDFKEVMFDNVSYGYRGVENLLDWLKGNVKDFNYTRVEGYLQGESCVFYKFNNSNNDDWVYLPLDEETLTSVYVGAIDIIELLPETDGTITGEWNNEGDIQTVGNFHIDENCSNTTDEYIDEYMKDNYNAVPAKQVVTYI